MSAVISLEYLGLAKPAIERQREVVITAFVLL
jgi:hypothetical protein